jgi:hypothetical protein
VFPYEEPDYPDKDEKNEPFFSPDDKPLMFSHDKSQPVFPEACQAVFPQGENQPIFPQPQSVSDDESSQPPSPT